MRGRLDLITLIATIIFFVLTLTARHVNHLLIFTLLTCYLILFTGYLVSRFIIPHTGVLTRLALAFTSGFFILYIFLLISALFKFDVTYIKYTIPALNLIIGFYLQRKQKIERAHTEGKNDPLTNIRLSGLQKTILIALLAFVVITIITVKDPLIYTSDSNDHIAYIRTISRTHEAFPEQFYYKDGGIISRDLRKSLYHTMWGTIEALTTSREVVEIWPIISAFGASFIIISLVCSVTLLSGEVAIGILSALLFVLLYHAGLKGYQLITIAYGYPFGKVFYLMFISSAIVYLTKKRKKYLIIAALSISVATMTHIGHFLIGAFTITSFTLLLLIYRTYRKNKPIILKAFLEITAISIAINTPYLLMRYLRDYYPANPIHTHLQGVLYLTDKFYSLNPIKFFESSGTLGIVSIICLLIFSKEQKRLIPLRLLLHTTLAVIIFVFNPIWIPFLARKLSYLLIRFEFAIPVMIIPSFLIFSLTSTNSELSFGTRKTRKAIGWLVVIIFLIIPSINAIKGFAYSGKRIAIKRQIGYLKLLDLFDEINKLGIEGEVFISDPLTSYAIPAFSDNFSVCPFDQHSTPNDSTALTRIAECRVIYDPYSSIDEIKRVIEKYGASYIVINGRVPEYIQTLYWKPSADVARQVIERYKKEISHFTLVYESNNLAIFKVKEGNRELTAEETKQTPPFYGPLIENIETKMLIPAGIDNIYIKEFKLSKKEVRRGEKVTVRVSWVTTSRQPVAGYIAYLRFDTDYPKSWFYSRRYSKLYRKVLERIKGKRFRFRYDFQPLGGIYPPYSWPTGRIIITEATVPIPKDIVTGIYAVSIKLSKKTQYPNYNLNDILSDTDMYSGKQVGTIEVY